MQEMLVRILRRYLVAGLLVWLPILATVFVIRFILGLFDSILLVLPPPLRPSSTLFGTHIPGLGAVLAFILVLFTGALASNVLGRRLVRSWEELMARIPVVRAVYGGVKSFSTTLLSRQGSSFKKVLLVQYPRAGVWSLGFQTAADVPPVSAQLGEDIISVFIPISPPTSGWMLMVPRSQVVELDISIDAAMKMIMTMGVVVPAAGAAEAGVLLGPDGQPVDPPPAAVVQVVSAP
jgi:uncharacterized membrane protein